MKERNIREIKELKPLAALLWILGPALGAACGYFGSKAFSIAYMFDISGIDEKDVNSDIYNSFWSVAFDNEHMQADLVGKYTVIAVVLAVLAIACVIGLMVMTGRFSRDENWEKTVREHLGDHKNGPLRSICEDWYKITK